MSIALTNDLIRRYLAHKRLPAPEEGRLHLIGIRGAKPWDRQRVVTNGTEIALRGDTFDAYDDAVGYFGTSLQVFKATTEPGRRYTQQPLNPQGGAHLQPGHYTYRRGIHRGHKALVQAAPVTIIRDRDRDGDAEPHEPKSSGYYGLNLHAGGVNEAVGPHSAGCQVLWGGWTGANWQTFYGAVEVARQDCYRYYLIEAESFSLFVDGKLK